MSSAALSRMPARAGAEHGRTGEQPDADVADLDRWGKVREGRTHIIVPWISDLLTS